MHDPSQMPLAASHVPDRPRILIVDDDPGVLTTLSRALAEVPAHLDTAPDPTQALHLIEATPYAVIISDQRMPTMEGTTLLEQAQTLCPDGIRILLSGHIDAETATKAINQGGVFRLLKKPWDQGELMHTVLQSLAEYDRIRKLKQPQAPPDPAHAALAELNQSLKKKVIERTWEVLDLNQKLQQSFMAAVQAMARLGEMHSNVAGNHSKRVAEVARQLAERRGLSPADVMQVEVAATLHDIGKTHTDPQILSKPPDTLTKRERIVLRMHVIHGEAIVRLLPDLEEAARFVRHHHERYDGNGYPNRLSGSDIPLGARIIAAANAYDHALHPRDTFVSATAEQALLEVQQNSNTYLDPDLVRLLTEMVLENEGDLPALREIEIHLRDMQPGMVLARDLTTSEGVLLLKAGCCLNQDQIDRLLHHHTSDPILNGLIIRRDFPASNGEPSPESPA